MAIAESIVNILLILLLITVAVAIAVQPMQIEFTRHALQERADGITRADIFRQMPKARCEEIRVWICRPENKLQNILTACKIENKDLWIRAVMGFLLKEGNAPSFVLITAYMSNTKDLEKTLKQDRCEEADPDLTSKVLKEVLEQVK